MVRFWKLDCTFVTLSIKGPPKKFGWRALLTLINLASLESAKAGYCSSYFWMACWAFKASTHKWQREARKKYSLALYFNKELSRAEAATCKINHNCKSGEYWCCNIKDRQTPFESLIYFWYNTVNVIDVLQNLTLGKRLGFIRVTQKGFSKER